jgi:ferredoxin
MLRQIIKIDGEKCNGCGICVSACHEGAIGMKGGKAVLLRDDYCDGLGKCLPVCPTGAISFEKREALEYKKPHQWPLQMKLIPVNAPYFENADLLVTADCAAYAFRDFHNEFMENKIILIGCPKLDTGDYSEKLSVVFRANNIRSITVVRMEVPCCSGIENAVKTALKECKKTIPWQVAVISTDGRLLG